MGWLIFCRVIPARKIPAELINCEKAVQDKNSLDGLSWISKSPTICFNHIGGDGNQTLFYGDSNTQQYAPRIRELLKNNKGDQRGALILSAGGEPPLPGVNKAGLSKGGEMELLFKDVLSKDSRINRVVIAARWDLYFNGNNTYRYKGIKLSDEVAQEAVLAALGEMIRNITKSNKSVVVVLSTPNGESLNPKHFYKRKFFGAPSKKVEQQPITEYFQDNGTINSRIATIAKANGAEVIDPIAYLSANGMCIAENEDGPIRYDKNHLRPGYVREHVKYLDQTVAP
jgi:hypothetical protein